MGIKRHSWNFAAAAALWLASACASAGPLGGGGLPGAGVALPGGIPSVGSALPGGIGGAVPGGIGGAASGVLQSVPGTVQNVTGSVQDATGTTLGNTLNAAANVVRDTVGRPPANAKAIEHDLNGARVVRGEVLDVSPTEQGLTAAKKLDFEIARRETLDSIGLTIVVLRAPDGMSVTDALKALHAADPTGSYDYNHIYDPSGVFGGGTREGSLGAARGAARIGMIDGGIDLRHPAFEGASIESKDVAGDGPEPATAHGTAVASLLIGQDGDFHGALSGTKLYAADVYGGSVTGGSADDIAKALAWLAAQDVPVTNISLVGPANLVLAAATASFVKTGHVLVAPVGNDGPAAPVRYPAAYPGVVAVTSVDAHRMIQLDANRGPGVAFAARGVEVRAATLHGYANVTGTSFAAPVVAARFALLVDRVDPTEVSRAWSVLERAAVDLGPPGRNPVFGYGYLDAPGVPAALTDSTAR
jgi:Subtilase family